MAHVLTSPELVTQRLPRQWSKSFLATPEAHTIYTARLDGVPASFDMVAELTVDTEAGNPADVFADMTLWVGSTAGDYNLGMCRIRKAPIAGTIYVTETSEVVWVDQCYLTIVDDYQLWAKPIRLVSSVPYMDWEIGYTDEHEDFDPVPCLGSDIVAKLVNGTVTLLIGPSDDVPSFAIGDSVASVLWSIQGISAIDDATIVNPTITIENPGTFLAYCEITAVNGKIFTGVRYIIVYDDANPLIQNFSIRNGRLNYETGSCSFDVTLYTGFSKTALRKRSKIILCTEDFAENQAITLPGQIEGRENILCIGWISEIDSSRESEFGEISFTVESAEYWMKKIRDYPVGLELDVLGSPSWTDMPGLTVDRAAWHMLHWRSTATRIMDIKLTDDTRLATRFQVARANLWERIEQISRPTIFASAGVDNFGRFFLQIEPQMVPEVDRTWPNVMTITDNDIEGGISWRRRDVNAISMLFFSGVYIDPGGSASSYFSMSPGHSYGHYGEEEPQDNYLVSGQSNSNQLCGLYYGWKNNDPYDLEIDFIHSMRILGMYPRQKYSFAVSPANDPRGIGIDKDFIIREIQFDQDPRTGFINFHAAFEAESIEGPAINGDVPTMESVDFSFPNLPELTGLPSLPALPIIVLPPTVAPSVQPKRVIIGSSKGVFYCENFDDSLGDVLWKSMNNGLTLAEYTTIRKMVVCPSGAIFIHVQDGSDRIYWAPSIGGSWTLLIDGSTFGGRIQGLGVNPTVNESIAFTASNSSAVVKFYVASRSGYSAGTGLTDARDDHYQDIAFMGSHWQVAGENDGVFATPWYWTLTPAGAAIGNGYADSTVGQDFATRFIIRAGAQDLAYQWDNSAAGGFNVVTGSGVTFTRKTSLTPVVNCQALAVSPTGTHLMGCQGTTPYKSTDSGATFVSVAGVIPLGSDIWESCGDNFRWIFGGGIIIRLTMDQGATYSDKFGNLLQIAALIDITQIRYISS